MLPSYFREGVVIKSSFFVVLLLVLLLVMMMMMMLLLFNCWQGWLTPDEFPQIRPVEVWESEPNLWHHDNDWSGNYHFNDYRYMYAPLGGDNWR